MLRTKSGLDRHGKRRVRFRKATGFSRIMLTASLHFVKISLHFAKLQGETGSLWTASSASQSGLSGQL
jgi:hypothetical protein